MQNRLKSLRRILEQSFGFFAEPERVFGGLSHEVYSLETEKIIVKVYSNEISRERLRAEALTLENLSTSRLVQTPSMIPSHLGEYRVPFDTTYLSCFRKLEGERRFLLTQCPQDLNSIQNIGRYLGLLHREVFTHSVEITHRKSPILEVGKRLPGIDVSQVESLSGKLSQSGAPYFLTHGDFQQSNLLYLRDNISGVVDFEYSALDYRINDIAGCLSNLLSANGSNLNSNDLIHQFIVGYEKSFQDQLLEIELDLLPCLLTIIWQVNLSWCESKLEQVYTSQTRALLELYLNQTKDCLTNCGQGLVINATIDF